MLIIRCFFIANLKGGDRMKIKVTTAFNDLQNGCITRPVNEVFECSDKRAKELMPLDYAKRLKTNSPRASLQKLKCFKPACVKAILSAVCLLIYRLSLFV